MTPYVRGACIYPAGFLGVVFEGFCEEGHRPGFRCGNHMRRRLGIGCTT